MSLIPDSHLIATVDYSGHGQLYKGMEGRPKHLDDEIDVKIFDRFEYTSHLPFRSHFLLPIQFYFMLYPKQPFFHLPWMVGGRVDVTQRLLPLKKE